MPTAHEVHEYSRRLAERDAQSRTGTKSTTAKELPVVPDTSPFEDATCDVHNVRDVAPLELVELVLKDHSRLDAIARSPAAQPALITRCLALSLAAFTFFGIAMSLVFHAAGQWPQLSAIRDVIDGQAARLLVFAQAEPSSVVAGPFFRGSAWTMTFAYMIGPTAALGVCLPSLYFYGLLAGLHMGMRDVVSHALKAQAVTSVALIGILPLYAAIGMGVSIFNIPEPFCHWALWLGLLLPFIAGLWGTRSLFLGFAGLCNTMTAEFRERRECFLRRLVLSWAVCYTAVAPVMIFTIWQRLS